MVTRYKKHFLLPDHQLGENLILSCFFQKDKSDKRQLVPNFVGIIVAIIFIYKCLSYIN